MKMVRQQIPQGNYVLLNSANSKGERCIYLRYFVDGKYVKRSTDIWVKDCDWDNELQVIKSSHPNADRLNHILSTKYESIRASLIDMLDDGINYHNLSALLACRRQTTTERRTTKSMDLIEYAHEVNNLKYKMEKYGYTSWYNKKKSIEAFETYIVHYSKTERPTFKNLTPSVFDEYVKYRFDVKKNTNKEGINKTLVPLYAALQYAADNGVIPVSQISTIVNKYLPLRETKYKSDSNAEKKIRYLTPEQIKYLYKYSKGIHSQNARDIMDMFFFSFFACGMRCSDLITLEWRHIDMQNKAIKKVQVKTKMEPNITIPLSDNAIEILSRWQKRCLNSRFVFNRLPEDFNVENERQLFLARNAKDKGFNRVLATVSRNAKLPFQITMHVARHSFAVMSINQGMSVHMLSRLLGHTSVLATEKTYAQFLTEKVKKDVENLLSFDLQ